MRRALTLTLVLLLTVIPAGHAFSDKHNPFEPEMVPIPSGTFLMGCINPMPWHCYPEEKPVHSVTIKTFEIGKYEVTNAQFVAFLNVVERRGTKSEPWFDTKDEDSDSQIIGSVGHFKVEHGKENFPVINVSWFGAKAYVKWLRRETGKHYRLPTEAEWEYAARAGTTTKYWWGNEASHDYANYGETKCCPRGVVKGADKWLQSAPVGSFPNNGFGLHDMHGNVWEWVEDCWHKTYNNAPRDGSAWLKADDGNCHSRVLRGGSWVSVPRFLRSANRDGNMSGNRDDNFGFRIARTLE